MMWVLSPTMLPFTFFTLENFHSCLAYTSVRHGDHNLAPTLYLPIWPTKKEEKLEDILITRSNGNE